MKIIVYIITISGKYYDGDKPDHKRWKANFRCALNSLLDVEEMKNCGVKRGNNAYKVYKFLDQKRERKTLKVKGTVIFSAEESRRKKRKVPCYLFATLFCICIN